MSSNLESWEKRLLRMKECTTIGELLGDTASLTTRSRQMVSKSGIILWVWLRACCTASTFRYGRTERLKLTCTWSQGLIRHTLWNKAAD
jgi:hypothetical protein